MDRLPRCMWWDRGPPWPQFGSAGGCAARRPVGPVRPVPGVAVVGVGRVVLDRLVGGRQQAEGPQGALVLAAGVVAAGVAPLEVAAVALPGGHVVGRAVRR